MKPHNKTSPILPSETITATQALEILVRTIEVMTRCLDHLEERVDALEREMATLKAKPETD